MAAKKKVPGAPAADLVRFRPTSSLPPAVRPQSVKDKMDCLLRAGPFTHKVTDLIIVDYCEKSRELKEQTIHLLWFAFLEARKLRSMSNSALLGQFGAP